MSGLTIRNGQADWGGGIYIDNAAPKLSNVTFCNNYSSYNGSAVNARRTYVETFPIFENCIIKNNNASTYGNILDFWSVSPIFRNCSIINNTGDSNILTLRESNGEVFNSTIAFNNGNGIEISGNSSVTINNSKIKNNEGSGIFLWYESGLYIENCLISSNTEDGVFLKDDFPIRIVNSIITNNGESGIQCRSNSSPKIINCTIAYNENCGIGVGGSFQPIILNCNVYNNGYYGVAKSIYDDGDPIIFYTNVYGSNVANFWNVIPGEGTIEEDPLFIAPEEGDFRLQIESPCINIGIADTIGWNFPLNDFAGYLRISGDIIGSSHNLMDDK